MRKIILTLLFILCLLLPAAALADSFTFAEQGAACSIPANKYTVLTPENLEGKAAWLEKNGKTVEDVQTDFAQRNVLLQAWSSSGDVCIEITAVQDHYAQQYYDVNSVNESERKAYRIGHSSDKTGEWRDQGYDYTSADWQKYKYAGRFLQLEYTRNIGGTSYRGIARKTIRNGWHFHVDYQVYGRAPKKADTNALEAIMTSWEFLEICARPSTSTTKVIFTATPPQETSTGKFTVAGTGSSGLKVVGVVMRMSSSDVHRFETVIDQKGKFDLAVKLPKEGLWTMTYTIFNGEEVIEEGAFDPITFNDTLLSVRLNTTLPKTMTLTGNSLTISGTTLAKTKVQCIVDGRYNKQITTNNSGSFSFTFDTVEEGIYNITLVFEKKGYDARRFRCEATREFNEQDRRQSIVDEAVKPSYSNLKKKIDGYRGRYMVYTLNIKEVIPTSTGYLTFAGMTKTKSGVYKEVVAIRTTDEPVWRVGTAVRMYLKCIGMYDVVGDDGTDSYPYFDLQFID
nr:hypothetical protein [Clostridia bacterium]